MLWPLSTLVDVAALHFCNSIALCSDQSTCWLVAEHFLLIDRSMRPLLFDFRRDCFAGRLLAISPAVSTATLSCFEFCRSLFHFLHFRSFAKSAAKATRTFPANSTAPKASEPLSVISRSLIIRPTTTCYCCGGWEEKRAAR